LLKIDNYILKIKLNKEKNLYLSVPLKKGFYFARWRRLFFE